MEDVINNLTTTGAEEGIVVSVVGDTYRIVVSGKETGGRYAAIDMLIPPGGGPGPHSHAAIEESFYVIEGEIEVKTEDIIYTAGKGAFVNIPPGGMVHCFKNKSQANTHLLCYVSPSGLEEFLTVIGKPVTANTFLPPPELKPEDLKKLQEIAEEYGQKLYPPDYLDK